MSLQMSRRHTYPHGRVEHDKVKKMKQLVCGYDAEKLTRTKRGCPNKGYLFFVPMGDTSQL